MAEPSTASRRPAPPEVDRTAASAAAVAARRARAAVKNAIAAREISPLVVLDRATAAPEGVEGRLRVTEFLLSVPAIGTTKMQEALQRLAISPAKRLGGLGRHQRLKLREFLIERENRAGRRRNRGGHACRGAPSGRPWRRRHEVEPDRCSDRDGHCGRSTHPPVDPGTAA